MNRNASAHAPIRTSKSFGVNLLAQEHFDLARRFSTKVVEGEARFDADAWETLATGAPALKDALATLDCELIDEHETQTHSIFIGRVLEGRFREDAQPLLYFEGQYRTST